jgi:outer membrane protein
MSSILRACGAASLLALVAAPLAQQATPKLAYIDSRMILDAAPGRAEAEAQLQKEGSAMKATIDKMNDAYLAILSDYTKLPPATPQADRDKKEKVVRDKQAELQQKNQEFQDAYNQRNAELLQPILDQIKLVLEDVRVEGNYTMIFDVGQGAAIVAVDKNLNITDRVIAKLRTMPKPIIAAKTDSAKKPVGAPINAPAGVSRPGSTPPATKRPDSASTKRPDSTGSKRPSFR